MGTTSANKGYSVPAVGGDADSWGTELNSTLGIIDTNMGGVATVSVAGSTNVTASTAQAQNLVQKLTGALTGSISYLLPATGGFYIIDNETSGAFTVTVITTAGGSVGVLPPQGTRNLVYSDATNVYDVVSFPGGSLTGALNEYQGANIASATTTDIGAATGNYIHITGTTTITGLGTIQAGTERTVIFDGALTLTYNATSLKLPSLASITTAAGDRAIFRSEGSGNWQCIDYVRASGAALVASGGNMVNTGASTSGDIPKYTDTTGTALADGYGVDTDGTLSADSDSRIATQKAVKTYVDAKPTPFPAFKNLLIGGDFTTNPWQRGTTFNSAASGVYTADRWLPSFTTVGSGVFNIASAADAPTVSQAGMYATQSLKVTVGTAATGTGAGTFFNVQQRIEDYNMVQLGFGQSGAQSVAVSFWVKSSVNGTYSVALGNTAGNRSYPVNFTINSANTWEKKTITIAGDTTGTWVTAPSAAAGLYLYIVLHTGSTYQGTNATWVAGALFGSSSNTNTFITTLNATFQLALVQLEAGSTATAFESLPEDVVLGRCRRYAVVATRYVPASTAQNLATLNMRATPTITGGGSGFTSTGTSANALIAYQTSGATAALTLASEL